MYYMTSRLLLLVSTCGSTAALRPRASTAARCLRPHQPGAALARRTAIVATGGITGSVSSLGVRPQGPEADIVVLPAGTKGKGAFAVAPIAAGTWLGNYQGVLTTRDETVARYGKEASWSNDYIMTVSQELELSRDARNSSHFSKFVNHAQFGNLELLCDPVALVVDLYAERDIAAGEELCFDYGVSYWVLRPHPEGDSRNFSDPGYRQRPPELALLYPPPIGTVLPLTPLTAPELQAALVLPEVESRCALLRCLEFYGARRLEPTEALRGGGADLQIGGDQIDVAEGAGGSVEWLELRCGVAEGAKRQVVALQTVPYETLQAAALACVVQAVLVPAEQGDPEGGATGSPAAEFTSWLDSSSDELRLLRAWRGRTPAFASARHDAAAALTYLLWKNPTAHGVVEALPREQVQASCELLQQCSGEEGVRMALAALGAHAPEEHLADLVTTLSRWFEVGAGCRVIANNPPKLNGAVPAQVAKVWDRAESLTRYGLLAYDGSGRGSFLQDSGLSYAPGFDPCGVEAA